MKFKDKSEIVDNLIELMKNSLLDDNQKQKILNVVTNLKNATENQKERFILLYQLDPDRSDYGKIKKIAQKDGCSYTAVRLSVISVRNKLARLKEEFAIIEEIVNEYQK